MTREEAINILNALKFILNNDQYTDEIEEALDMAISALQQPNQFADGDKKDDHLREVTKKVDVIGRQAANQTVLEFIIEYLGGAFDEVFQKKLMERMNALPSVQPEHFREVTKKVDVVSRQAVIDVLDVGVALLRRALDGMDIVGVEREKYRWGLGLIESYVSDMKESMKDLPPAQTESLTDKEQRIFLAAMEREEKVCEEVDRNYVREPYEDSLMRVCKEIRRKVKGVLWT